MGTVHDARDLEREYRAMVRQELLPDVVRLGALLFFLVSTVFVFVDWWLYRDRFWEFLPSRVLTDLAALVIGLWTYRSRPLLSAFVGIFIGGSMLLFVIHRTGGAASDYYVGLVLFIMAIGVMAPFRVREAALAIGALFVAHAALSIAEIGGVDQRLGLQLFFLSTAALIGVVSCGLLDRMRFTDFRKQRELERAHDELAELDRAKSRFTANVHHELRTPLTLMLAPLDSMLAGDVRDLSEVQAYLKTMRVNGLRLLKLINNLLDLAKVESGGLTLHRRPVEVGRFLAELITGARPMAERKEIHLALAGVDELPLIHADPEALEEVVVNLVGNALKFTPVGGRIEVRGEAAEGGVHLAVSDSGIGIPAEKLDRIFDRFAQVDMSATRQYEGTGIGLSLTKELVERHGGRIWAESPGVGQGATIHVVLPSGEPDEGLDEEVLATSAGESVALGRSFAALEAELGVDECDAADYRMAEMERTVARQTEGGEEAAVARPPRPGPEASEVVVVEDNPEMRRLLSFLVGREFRVRTAQNGRDALEMVRERPPDLVLTDIMMPELSGTDLCRAVKADPALRSIPVVLITSKAEREMQIEGLELGAEDYVTKPFHPRELLARVRSLVRLRMLQRELEEQNASLEKALTELKDAEAQLVQAERLAAVGELSASVAHEVGNPLNFAVNSVQILKQSVLDLQRFGEAAAAVDWRDDGKVQQARRQLTQLAEEIGLQETTATLHELVEIITDGLERTRQLVADLRDFGAPGQSPRSRVDLGVGLEATLRLLGPSMKRAGGRIETEVPAALPPVRGDARALNQVFLNLLKNAIEAMEGRKEGVVQVRAWSDAGRVAISIRDEGPGIEERHRARIFEPFFTTKQAGRGTGLGLAMCRRIVEAHGGSIDVDSAPGQGTTFTVRLPSGAEEDAS